ncbi:Hypothetical predicted protein [Paramuricea clavata]|uniref:Uncharacterized protein n=1 Tax=Paramuricea clavata TaxID=317549 RepID=A0A7D9J0C0_PARCT|nr:Hypothetical predicted protein [Paramuricea clavata]
MNLAEVIHASWVKRDKGNTSLLNAVYADAHDNVQLEFEYKAFRARDSRGGMGSLLQDKALQKSSHELWRACVLGQEFIRDGPDLTCALATSRYTDYHVHIGSQHSYNCQGYVKYCGKQACKHMIWTLLFVCGIQEDSEILQQVSLTIEDIRQITANTPNNIPEPLKVMEETKNSIHQRQSRKVITTHLLANDSRKCSLQIWYLE